MISIREKVIKVKQSSKPNVVVLGGGTGMPVLLRGLKKQAIQLTTIVTVADDGGSTGRLREVVDMPAPGDIRNTIVALSNVDKKLEELFQYRFETNKALAGHALGNIVLVAMSAMAGDFYQGIKKASELLNVTGDVYPIVNEPVVLHAEMTDGKIVSGESNIQLEHKKIKRVYITPRNVKPMIEVINAILKADVIVISPGSLYTSILPNLIIHDVVDALKSTTAKIVYVCNVMTQDGETNDYTVLDHVQAISSHVGFQLLDAIIVHNEPIKEAIIKRYETENAAPVIYDKEALQHIGIDIIEDNIVEYWEGTIRHDTEKLAELLYEFAKAARS